MWMPRNRSVPPAWLRSRPGATRVSDGLPCCCVAAPASCNQRRRPEAAAQGPHRLRQIVHDRTPHQLQRLHRRHDPLHEPAAPPAISARTPCLFPRMAEHPASDAPSRSPAVPAEPHRTRRTDPCRSSHEPSCPAASVSHPGCDRGPDETPPAATSPPPTSTDPLVSIPSHPRSWPPPSPLDTARPATESSPARGGSPSPMRSAPPARYASALAGSAPR